jgi:hypothetical protein
MLFALVADCGATHAARRFAAFEIVRDSNASLRVWWRHERPTSHYLFSP